MTGNLTKLPGQKIDACLGCGLALPLRDGTQDDSTRSWLCAGCGHEYFASLDHTYQVEQLRHVRPKPFIIDRASIPEVTPELVEYAESCNRADARSVEKRNTSRHSVIMCVPTIPFDDRMRQADPPFMAVIRNISTGGVCLLHSQSVRTPFLGIELSAPGGDLKQVLARICRCRPRNGFYEIGTEFVTRMAVSTSRIMR